MTYADGIREGLRQAAEYLERAGDGQRLTPCEVLDQQPNMHSSAEMASFMAADLYALAQAIRQRAATS